MVGIGSDRGAVTVNDRLSRNRMKPRLQAKPVPTVGSNQRKNIGITDLNRRITDLKMEGGVPGQTQSKTQLTELQQRLQPPGNTQAQIRRDSNSTVSSYYGSMRSADMSRKSSLASQASSMRPGIGPSSFYDPISAGSSRRSSQLSTATTGGACIPPPPPSHLLAGQLQKVQTSPSKNSNNLVLQVRKQHQCMLRIPRRVMFLFFRRKTSHCSKQRSSKRGCHQISLRVLDSLPQQPIRTPADFPNRATLSRIGRVLHRDLLQSLFHL